MTPLYTSNVKSTKYNPQYRNEEGEYQKSEWTSCHDIGKLYDGKEFTVNDYMVVENAYIYAVLSFVNCANITTLIVKHLERHNASIANVGSPLVYTEGMKKLFENLYEGLILEIKEIEDLCRLILREQLWCKLESDNKMFVHFGYDYYMYIGCLLKHERISNLIEGKGLFIEEFKSPYA